MTDMFTPPTYISSINTTAILAVYILIAVAMGAVAVRIAVRERDILPIAALIGGALCTFNEPIFDVLGKITYADNSPMAFTALGREIPWMLFPCYIAWIGVAPILIARAMANGVPRTRLHVFAVLGFFSVVIGDSFGNWCQAWVYYGEPPLKYLGVAPQMPALLLIGGFLFYAIGSITTGWRRAILGLLLPTIVLPMAYASMSWPVYVANYADVPKIVEWIATIGMVVLVVATIATTTKLAKRWREGEFALSAAKVPVSATAYEDGDKLTAAER
jgi:hypothetical protein